MSRTRTTMSIVWAALVAAAGVSPANAQDRQTIVFSTTQTTVVGESIYVLGDLPELGAGDMTRAVKLEPSQYPLWRLPINLPSNRAYTYRFVKRTDSAATMRVPTNGVTVAGPTSASTTTTPISPASKALLYHSGWSSPVMWTRSDASASFSPTTMIEIGAGRGEGERRWVATGASIGKRNIEFYFTPGFGSGRDPTVGAYSTALDAAFVQDGQVFTYVPVGNPATGLRDYSAASLPFIDSVAANLNERRFYRVWLPRGYAQHTARRYPVLYMHDGQNCFEPGAFGTWNADIAASQQISRGAMREAIIVAIDSNANRFVNYVPNGDITPAAQAGNASAYLRFLRDELKPRIDAQYRTLADSANTATMGSSMGGQVSMVLGWDAPGTFSKIGALSNYWSTNFRNRVTGGAKPNVRLYMDSGDSGTASDNFGPTFTVRDMLLTAGRAGGSFVSEFDFRHTVGFNQQHNEAAWASRVGGAMSFLFPATEDANALVPLASGEQFDANADSRLTLDDAYVQFASAVFDVNVDGAVDEQDGRAVVGVVRRDERTRLMELR